MKQHLGFSIVIPTYNRPEQLADCLYSIGRLDLAGQSVEVIIVDDGGLIDDHRALQNRTGAIPLRLVSQSRGGPAAARNAGAREAAGAFLIFVDDDCTLPQDWLTKVNASAVAHPDAMIGGRTINALSGNLFSEASQTLVDYVYRYYNSHGGRSTFFASNNMAISAAGFAAVGGFDERFRTAEDRELCRRWSQRGGKFHFDESIIVHHAHRLSTKSMLAQHFGYGRGAYPYWNRAACSPGRIEVEPARFYFDMLRFPFTCRKPNAFAISMLITLSQTANAAGFAYELYSASRAKRRTAVRQNSAAPSTRSTSSATY